MFKWCDERRVHEPSVMLTISSAGHGFCLRNVYCWYWGQHMNKQEWQYALESDFINVCLLICTALLTIPRSTAVRSCVSMCPRAGVGTHSYSCPHRDIICVLKWLSCSKWGRHTRISPLLKPYADHAVRVSRARGLGWLTWDHPRSTPSLVLL